MMDISRYTDKAAKLGLLDVMVTRDDELIAEVHLDENCRRNLYSATKSFTSAAVGFAVREGLVDLKERLVDCFPQELPDEVSENLEKATVRDLLTMCLGQEKGFLMGKQRPFLEENDWVRAALAVPFVYEPGTRFVYNNVGPYLAGILVQRRAGCDMISYLMPRLFTPLGIRRPMCEEDPMRNTFGAGGMFMTCSELHKFGLLYLRDGVWQGKRLLPEEWVRESTSKQVENDTPYGYGYLFWGGRENTFRADGKYCQLTIICRDKNAVITTLAESHDSHAFRDAIMDELYPLL